MSHGHSIALETLETFRFVSGFSFEEFGTQQISGVNSYDAAMILRRVASVCWEEVFS